MAGRKKRTMIVDQGTGQEIVKSGNWLQTITMFVIMLFLVWLAVDSWNGGDIPLALGAGALILLIVGLRGYLFLIGRTPYNTPNNEWFINMCCVSLWVLVPLLVIEINSPSGTGPLTWFLAGEWIKLLKGVGS